jgi:hypothetical protein
LAPTKRRQADGVIAFARADIGDRHAGFDAGELHNGFELADAVARILVRIAGGDDRRDRALRLGKGDCAGCCALHAGGEQGEEERRPPNPHLRPRPSHP